LRGNLGNATPQGTGTDDGNFLKHWGHF
jgi:hypothetical protein